MSGCTNLFGLAEGRGLASDVNTVAPTSGTGVHAVKIDAVLLSNSSNRIFDLIGDGSGQIGALCKPPPSEPGEDGASGDVPQQLCACNYSFIRPDGGSGIVNVPADSYIEDNLLRCPIEGFPENVPYVNVRIHLTHADAYSNSIRFRFSGVGHFLDLTNPNSFVQPFRYQCRDSIVMPFAFGMLEGAAEMYDPLLSDDPAVAFSWNHYASNMYAAANAFISANVSSNGAGFTCPATPNDPGAGTDLTLFSMGPDSAGSARIFPATGSAFDRATFFLARHKSAEFNVAVNAYVAPGVITSEHEEPVVNDPTRLVPIGYGVAPKPLDNGTEVCPDTSVQIPPGFKWVKLWQFRASLDARNAPTSTRLARTSISCNPGYYSGGSSPPNPAVPSCYPGGLTLPDPNTPDAVLADRPVYGTSSGGQQGADVVATACMVLTHPDPSMTATACNDPLVGPGSGAGCTANFQGAQKPLFGSWPTASDVWSFRSSPAAHCGGGAQNDTLGLCQFPPSATVPFDDDIQLVPLDQNSRYDFLLVVTPPTVHLRQMLDPSDSSVLPYIPYRFYPGKCVSGNPAAPAFMGDCAVHNRINYSIKLHDVNLNGDAPPSSQGRLPAFPVCALQPI